MKKSITQDWQGALFVFPVFITLFLLILYPMLFGFRISFYDTNLVNKWNFVGFKYYIRVLTDEVFYKSVRITAVFTFFVVMGRLVFGTFLAMLLNVEKVPFRVVFRSILVMPWFFPDVVVGILWKWLFNPSIGLVNSILMGIGVLDGPMNWVSNPDTALITVILVSIWKGTSFIMIMVLANLQTIPSEQYEAGLIDGANVIQRFRYITLPGISNSLSILALLSTMWCFKHFTIVWNMTQGGPVDATNVVSIDIYKTGFSYFRFGESATRAVIVFIIIICFSYLTKFNKKESSGTGA